MRHTIAATAALLAGLLGTPAHALPTAMNARLELHFPCYGCGAIAAAGTLTCPVACVHDGIPCVLACTFPVYADVVVPTFPCPTGTARGRIEFGGDDAEFLMTFTTSGPAIITMTYASGATATGGGKLTITAPVGVPCGMPADGTFDLTITGA